MQDSFNLGFLELASKLKLELRHSWPGGKDGRRESVAEHSWRLVLMVQMYHQKLNQKVDVEKCMLYATIHDLPEAIVGDIPVIIQTKEIKKQKDLREQQALLQMTEQLDPQTRDVIRNAYHEYEQLNTYEAKFVKALDKIEAFQQHNLDPLDTWEEKEKEMLFQHRYLMKHCEFDSFLKAFAQAVIDQGVVKLEKAGENVEQIKENAKEKDKLLDL